MAAEIIRVAAKKYASMMVENTPRIIESIHPVFEHGFEEKFLRAMSDPDIAPFLVSSHTSHGDAFPLGKVAHLLTLMIQEEFGGSRLNGFVIPIAASMGTGHQGAIIQEATKQLDTPLRENYHLEPYSYTRQKDTQSYGLERDDSIIGTIIDKIRNGYGLADFPEATMQAGRSRSVLQRVIFQKPKRYGMQPFTKMERVPLIFKRARKSPLYIPIGIDGGFKIESPNHNLPTLGFTIEAFFTHPENTKLVSVRVGLPITHEELMEEVRQHGKDVNYLLGKKVAALLSTEEAQGVYA